MAKKDLFAPPTKEELNLFSPPTKEELAFASGKSKDPRALKQEEDFKDVKDISRGMAEGATFGLADELYGAGAGSLSGAGKEILNKMGGNFADEDTEAYKKSRDESRKSLEESKERSPYLTTGGELAGGFLVPGLGAAKGIGAGISTGAKIGKAALTGAIGGGIAGVGSSEAESGTSLANDALSGAELGGVLGGATGVVGAGLGAAKKALKESKTGKLAKTAFEEGKKGLGFSGESEIPRLQQQKEAVASLSGDVGKVQGSLGKEIQTATDLAGKNGEVIESTGIKDLIPSINMGQELEKSRTILGPEAKGLLDKFVKGEPLSPTEANELRRVIRDKAGSFLSKGMATLDDQKTAENLQSMAGALEDQLKAKVPNFEALNQKFGKFKDLMKESLTGHVDNKMPDDKQLNGIFQDIVERSSLPGSSKEGEAFARHNFLEAMKKFQTEHPESLAKAGVSPEAIEKLITEQSNLSGIRKAISRENPNIGTTANIKSDVLGFGTSIPLQSANIAGKVVGNLYKATPEVLQNLTAKLSNSPTAKRLGEMLQKSLAPDASMQSRNAALFSIAQNPEARGIAKEMGFTVGSEEDQK